MTKQLQIAELRRQIEEQRKHNEELRRYNDYETVRLRNELADHREELHRSLADIRTEISRRDRERSLSPPSRLLASSGPVWASGTALPYATSTASAGYPYIYRYSSPLRSVSPYRASPLRVDPIATSVPVMYESAPSTSLALPSTWSSSYVPLSSSLPAPASSLPLSYSTATYRASPSRQYYPSTYLATPDYLPPHTLPSHYVY
eukprot:GGOE01001185.1.p2 GENE.GGOE01001185.1~~GGOE01001185.1.p2  ORF type:complete len:228 (+),score=52.19 GGOE01001185.1:75-686(+)